MFRSWVGSTPFRHSPNLPTLISIFSHRSVNTAVFCRAQLSFSVMPCPRSVIVWEIQSSSLFCSLVTPTRSEAKLRIRLISVSSLDTAFLDTTSACFTFLAFLASGSSSTVSLTSCFFSVANKLVQFWSWLPSPCFMWNFFRREFTCSDKAISLCALVLVCPIIRTPSLTESSTFFACFLAYMEALSTRYSALSLLILSLAKAFFRLLTVTVGAGCAGKSSSSNSQMMYHMSRKLFVSLRVSTASPTCSSSVGGSPAPERMRP
mmetsp:Transcript_136065/g.322469  ORF Transcript_136065/g.322469 Transcript_136065/m.322469 type:complete len:263 (+) Transcript_136065:416-1204(+)